MEAKGRTTLWKCLESNSQAHHNQDVLITEMSESSGSLSPSLHSQAANEQEAQSFRGHHCQQHLVSESRASQGPL